MPMPFRSSLPAGKNVLLFNVKFSENLGDGLIAEAIEDRLRCQDPMIASVCSIDLAGRQDYGDVSVRYRSAKLQALAMVPKAARGRVVSLGLTRRLAGLKTQWRKAIDDADHVVIGGGHLFQDDNLNFPSKIGLVLQLCSERRVPVSVYSVGVTDTWSSRGKGLFKRLTSCNVVSVSVRDDLSRRNWSRHFTGTQLHAADVSLDPVLCSSAQAVRVVPSGPVGLCITSPTLLRHHMATWPGDLVLGYVRLCQMLAASGHSVTLFTNGAREDESLLDELVKRPDLAALIESERVARAPRSTTPRELRLLVATLRAVIAHRLHANILAYAHGIPSVGLAWDEKVRSFFDLTGRRGFFVPADQVVPSRVVQLLESAILQGVDPVTREEIGVLARANLEALRHTIGAC